MYGFIGYTVEQFMTAKVVRVTLEVKLGDLETQFRKFDFNAFPVVENEKLIGLVTKFDFLKAFAFTEGRILPPYEELMNRSVADVMTKDVISVRPETPLTRVLDLIVLKRIRSFPVVSGVDKLVGMISREDLMRALKQATTSELG